MHVGNSPDTLHWVLWLHLMPFNPSCSQREGEREGEREGGREQMRVGDYACMTEQISARLHLQVKGYIDRLIYGKALHGNP